MKKNTPILTTSFIVAILLTFFLWKENFSLSVPINSNKFGDFATILGSLLTALTVFLLYRQIKEMLADRKAGNQPDLFPSETRFETEDLKYSKIPSEEGHLPVPTFRKLNKQVGEMRDSLETKLYNIGLGAAKEIKVKWIYSETEVQEFIKNVYGGTSYSCPEEVIDFIPAGSTVDISLPYFYMQTCGTLLNDDLYDTLIENNKDKPNLILSITFNDIYSNEHKREFVVKLNCIQNFIKVKFRQKQLQP